MAIHQGIRVLVDVSPAMAGRGDEIEIRGIIENVSDRGIRIFTRPQAYAIGHVRLYDLKGERLAAFRKVFYEVRREMAHEFENLRPGRRVVMKFRGVVREDHIVGERRGEMISGLFLDFGDSAILLPGPGQYGVVFVLDHWKGLAEDAERRFGLTDVWFGTVVSDRAVLDIRP